MTTIDRRDFVRTSTAALAAAALPRQAYCGSSARKLERIGVQLYTLRTELRRDFEGTLARVAEIGFKEVEFAGYYERTPEQIRSTLARLGLSSPAGHMPYESLGDGWSRTLDLAGRTGHQYVAIAWTPVEARQSLDDWKRIGEKFNLAGKAAREAGLTFAYHNHEFEFVPLEGRIPFDILLEQCDPALVKIEMDLYWIALGGRDPLDYFRRYPGRFPMVHVKDMKRVAPKPEMVDVGVGDIDFKTIFGRSEEAGIRHYFVEHDEPRAPLESIRASFQYLRRLEF